MPRPSITPEQRLETRERIRVAAATLLRQGSPEKINIRSVAKEAGVSVGTIYKYFEDISDLGRSLWQEPLEALRRQMADIAQNTEEPIARIRALLGAYAAFAKEKHRVFRGAFLYVRPETREKPQQTQLEDEPFSQLLKSAIIEGQENGTIVNNDAKMLTQLLWAALHGALALPINIENIAFEPPEQIADEMIDSMMAMITQR